MGGCYTKISQKFYSRLKKNQDNILFGQNNGQYQWSQQCSRKAADIVYTNINKGIYEQKQKKCTKTVQSYYIKDKNDNQKFVNNEKQQQIQNKCGQKKNSTSYYICIKCFDQRNKKMLSSNKHSKQQTSNQ